MPGRGPSAILRFACALILSCLAASCARAKPAGIASGPGDVAGASLWELTEVEGAVRLLPSDPASLRASASLRPWPEALAVSALDELDGVIAVAVNRGGLAFIGLGPEAPFWDCPGDPAFRERSIVSAWTADGRFWAFLAENRAFADGEADDAPPSRIHPLLLSRAPGEASYRRHPLAWEDDASGAWTTTYLAPVGRGFFVMQMARRVGWETRWRYLRARIDGSGAAELGWTGYVEAFEPLPPERIDPSVWSLCDPDEALGRYEGMEGFPGAGAAVLLSLRLEGGVTASSFLRGSAESSWTATISARSAGGGTAALHPGGLLAIAVPGGGAALRVRLPTLPPSFDYEGVSGAGRRWACAWTERVFPGAGRAGLALWSEGGR